MQLHDSGTLNVNVTNRILIFNFVLSLSKKPYWSGQGKAHRIVDYLYLFFVEQLWNKIILCYIFWVFQTPLCDGAVAKSTVK